ncbi:hypothetical protein [Acetobacter malorum]|uniref:hypothetical protein n=1 Tax=Acetobacter malorum TaxID=178901 RepID=UPI00248E4E9A|nr:hypothetical protein [Acetobacter malorum]
MKKPCHLALVAQNQRCPACNGSGIRIGTWTGGDLFHRISVSAYGLCLTCDGKKVVPRVCVSSEGEQVRA